ncbi:MULTISPECIES: hypothetical protein [Flavobacterium]|jgi:hypothetical protein|uniref:Beta-carotene 15,15'-monooxygenase n=1 Tax=Flavobacterium anhuiense TaxID=459526 RepID=A0AAC9CX60_9FLAO|nr:MULTISPECIES: hypothetical protein [Flavobacterium]AOC93395.1 hypothetical protein BB050_00239 [Flavobacterium anhuiense]EJG02911.1 hypothetical protein FF52_01925 [Flavobacterium sp. F52]SCY22003.1 hypothetical protein SAMN02927916_1517 [Flavobacterium anhuiense]
MKELDLLKKDWQKNSDSFQQISENEIYKMIHRKSSSIVKWILIISILEISFWTFSNLFINTDDVLHKMNHPEIVTALEFLTYFNYVVVLIFVYIFYKNYKTISTTIATKSLMSAILRTRKTVQYYVWYNLGMIVITAILSFFIAFVYNPDMEFLREKLAMNGKAMFVTIGILFLVILGFFGLFWCFYRIIYGTLLRRLYANYKELKKIDF